MRIKTFGLFVANNLLTEQTLNNKSLVIDAQLYLYNLYRQSGLTFEFGCESDKYAQYLRNHLSMFKKANINCYFIFKGGHEDKKNIFRDREQDNFVAPIFMMDIHKQVLDDMGFNYSVCEFEITKECASLACKLNCPLLSNNIAFVFSGATYVPSTTLKYDPSTNTLTGGTTALDYFLAKYYLTDNKLAYFILLTDLKYFPENYFLKLLKDLKIPLSNYVRNERLITWLANTNKQDALNKILQTIDQDDRTKFLEAEVDVKSKIRANVSPGIPSTYLLNQNNIEIKENDPQWFQKGVAAKYVPIPYINLYNFHMLLGSGAIEDIKNDGMRLSLDIVDYAFGLLTNFKKDKYLFYPKQCKEKAETRLMTVTSKNSVQKSFFDSFKNGWEKLDSKKLFEFFLRDCNLNFGYFKNIPDDAIILVLALMYFSQKSQADTTLEAYSIMLSYVLLQKTNVRTSEYEIALKYMEKYFKCDHFEFTKIFSEKIMHPLVEFQHCLQQLNYLNILCGSPYKPTIYENTYNGTFIYKILYEMKTTNSINAMDFLKIKFYHTKSVFIYFKKLIETYEMLLNEN